MNPEHETSMYVYAKKLFLSLMFSSFLGHLPRPWFPRSPAVGPAAAAAAGAAATTTVPSTTATACRSSW